MSRRIKGPRRNRDSSTTVGPTASGSRDALGAFENIMLSLPQLPIFADVEFLRWSVRKERGAYLLSAIVDRPGGVGTELCESVNLHIARLADLLPPPVPPYRVEVASAGLERPLTDAAHFARFAGRPVKIVTTLRVKNRTDFNGRIRSAGSEAVTIDDPLAGEAEIPYGLIKRANLIYDPREDLRKQR